MDACLATILTSDCRTPQRPVFESLFKFSRLQFAAGSLGVQAVALFAVVFLLGLGLLAFVYWRTNRFPNRRTRWTSFGLRAGAWLLLCLPLLEPVLITPDVVPDENFVAVLVDGSASMAIPDGPDGATRYAAARNLLFDPDDGFAAPLADVFQLRYYTFADEASRVDSVATSAPDGSGTNLSTALERVLADFQGLPLAGVVLLSDGGDTSTDVPLNQAEALRSRGIPLHVVGVGQASFAQERELLEATAAKSVEETTGAEIDVKVRSWAQERRPVTFRLFEGETEVFTAQRPLKGAGKIDQFSFFFEPETPGTQVYTLKIDEAPEETNTVNNALDLLIETARDTLRVLYFEGHLRREFKFTKRALEDDQVVSFTSVSRTGTGKFYRQGIASPDELRGGFPATPAELYQFKAVVLGDVEASFFSIEQLQMLESFVRIRGGGFLMLGGRLSFAEGNYWNTPLADLLPVELDPSRAQIVPRAFVDPAKEPAEQGFHFAPTALGFDNPILKLAADPAQNRSRWATMPTLTSLNYLGRAKPGAQILARKPDDDFGDAEPLLVVQRYGRGRSAALATASTWRWQMHLATEDTRHERIWRQLVRWLAASAPDPVALDLGPRRFAPGAAVPLRTTVFDDQYFPVADATVTARLTTPSGAEAEVPLTPSLTEPGLYTAPYVPDAEGIYEVAIAAQHPEGGVTTGSGRFLVRPSKAETYNATLKQPFLEHLATTAGGQYYAAEATGDLPEALRSRRTSTSIFHADYLWDLPLLFLLALGLLIGEWAYRRRKGLP